MPRLRASWRCICTARPATSRKPTKGKSRSSQATWPRESATRSWSSRPAGATASPRTARSNHRKGRGGGPAAPTASRRTARNNHDMELSDGIAAITTSSEEETGAAGARLAATLHAGDVVLLYGDLGAGKTAFVRGMAGGVGAVAEEVSSPT